MWHTLHATLTELDKLGTLTRCTASIAAEARKVLAELTSAIERAMTAETAEDASIDLEIRVDLRIRPKG